LVGIVIVIEFVKSDACGPGSNYPSEENPPSSQKECSGNKKSWSTRQDPDGLQRRSGTPSMARALTGFVPNGAGWMIT
jgi:hypothetical protein